MGIMHILFGWNMVAGVVGAAPHLRSSLNVSASLGLVPYSDGMTMGQG